MFPDEKLAGNDTRSVLIESKIQNAPFSCAKMIYAVSSFFFFFKEPDIVASTS